jgi:hypothetical protein
MRSRPSLVKLVGAAAVLAKALADEQAASQIEKARFAFT